MILCGFLIKTWRTSEARHLHRTQTEGPAPRLSSSLVPWCRRARAHDLGGPHRGGTLGRSGLGSRHQSCRGGLRLRRGGAGSSLGECERLFLLYGRVLGAAQHRGRVGEWGHGRAGDAARGGAALSRGCAGGRGVGVAVLPLAQRVDPAGAVARGEGRQRQRGQTHVLARGDQLTEALLVGKGVARPPGPPTSPQPALRHAAHGPPDPCPTEAHRLALLLPHQLCVAHLQGGEGEFTIYSLQRFLGKTRFFYISHKILKNIFF